MGGMAAEILAAVGAGIEGNSGASNGFEACLCRFAAF
jgi:hypothetical protein